MIIHKTISLKGFLFASAAVTPMDEKNYTYVQNHVTPKSPNMWWAPKAGFDNHLILTNLPKAFVLLTLHLNFDSKKTYTSSIDPNDQLKPRVGTKSDHWRQF